MRTLVAALTLLAAVPLVAAHTQTGTPQHQPGGFSSPAIGFQDSWNLTLATAGTYYYHCHPHPWMRGVIQVEEGAPASAVTVRAVNYEFAPEDVRLAPDTTITFRNDDNDTHYVTESVPPAGADPGGDSPALAAIPAALVIVAVGFQMVRRRR